jgi:hypothetical protein
MRRLTAVGLEGAERWLLVAHAGTARAKPPEGRTQAAGQGRFAVAQNLCCCCEGATICSIVRVTLFLK